jgi:hypothetical protein
MAPDGDFTSFDEDDIEIGAKWDGEPGAFVAAAKARRLLDEVPDGLVCHDWEDYSGSLKAADRKRTERAAKKAKGPGRVVYFADIGNGCVKIGHSENVLRRMQEHRNDYSVVPRPIGFIPGGPDLESKIHKKFNHLRDGRLEHFKLEPDLQEYIDGHVTRCDLQWKTTTGHVGKTDPPRKQNGSRRPTDRPERPDQTDRNDPPDHGSDTGWKLPEEKKPDGSFMRSAFAARYLSATGMEWAHAKYHTDCVNLQAWCEGQVKREDSYLAHVAGQLVDNFFRDDWAAKAGFPFSALSKDPGKYYKPGGVKAEPESVFKRDADGNIIPSKNPYETSSIAPKLRSVDDA